MHRRCILVSALRPAFVLAGSLKSLMKIALIFIAITLIECIGYRDHALNATVA